MRDPYRRYRRHARRNWRGRRDPFPVLFIDPGEPLGLIAAAALARWAYRHRSAFLPFAITAAAFIAAALIHPQHRRVWLAAALATAAITILAAIPHRLSWASPAARITAGIITRMWEACGIDRPAERIYAATVIAVTGGWLSAAIALGPAVKPLPAIAGISTVILGIPWWAHRRRRARVRAERTVAAWPDIADTIGLPGSKIASLVVDAWGWTARVMLRRGTTAAQAINQLPAIESGLGLRPGSARAIPDSARADRFTLRVIETDPHAQPIPWHAPSATSITQPVGLGLFEDGRPVRVMILRRNVLIGGTTGAGKSGLVNVILAALAACGDVVIWGIDLKGGMELQPWAQCLTRLATTPEQAIALFADAITELDQRAASMAAAGRRVWEPIAGYARAGHRGGRIRRTPARGTGLRRFPGPARPGRRRQPARRDPAAHPGSNGPQRGPLTNGRPDMPARTGTPRRRPHPRPRVIHQRMARAFTDPARDIPDIRRRAHRPGTGTRLPDHRRPGGHPRRTARSHPAAAAR